MQAPTKYIHPVLIYAALWSEYLLNPGSNVVLYAINESGILLRHHAAPLFSLSFIIVSFLLLMS